jgi:hypothetical protein
MYNEREFQRYQEYLANKRQNIQPGLGHFATTLLLAPVGMGVIEPGYARGIENKMSDEAPVMGPAYQAELGALTARNVIRVDFTPREALRSAESQLTAA